MRFFFYLACHRYVYMYLIRGTCIFLAIIKIVYNLICHSVFLSSICLKEKYDKINKFILELCNYRFLDDIYFL